MTPRRRLRNRCRPWWPHQGVVSMHLVLGLLISVLGLLFLISNLDLFELRSPMKYFWAAALVALGTALIIEPRNERSRQLGIALVIAGLWTFAYKSQWIAISIWDVFVPVVMLIGGAYLVQRALSESRGESAPHTPLANETSSATDSARLASAASADRVVRGIGFLSASELKPQSQALERAELYALMGGVKLDLYDAQLLNGAATIQVGACMGGIEIHAPSEWTVISNVMPLMGAYVDKRRPAAAGSATSRKTLTINGFVLMGGVEIKN